MTLTFKKMLKDERGSMFPSKIMKWAMLVFAIILVISIIIDPTMDMTYISGGLLLASVIIFLLMHAANKLEK
jgi:hypothetical protein